MKIRNEHYEHLEKEIRKIPVEHILARKQIIIEENKFKNLDVRLAWDIAVMADLINYVCDELYNYINDDHITTALKKIVKDYIEENKKSS